jgi:hypothetical protein
MNPVRLKYAALGEALNRVIDTWIHNHLREGARLVGLPSSPAT